MHPPLVSRDLFDRVQTVLDAHSSGGERSWKHDHYLKGTLVCAECGSKMYFALAKGRFGYFRCIGRNTGRTRCSHSRYVPAAELEREVEALYESVRIPAALKRRLERVLRVEVAERERHRAEATVFLGRRLRQLANEREKLLRAYFADAIDVQTLKREQARINAEVAQAESQLATDSEMLRQATKVIDLALDLAKNCAASYRKAKHDVRSCGTRPSSARSASRTAGSRIPRMKSPSRPFSVHTRVRWWRRRDSNSRLPACKHARRADSTAAMMLRGPGEVQGRVSRARSCTTSYPRAGQAEHCQPSRASPAGRSHRRVVVFRGMLDFPVSPDRLMPR
jgi:hypothetical protein